MKKEELKNRHKILSQYGKDLDIRYENYMGGSSAMSGVFFLLGLVALIYGLLKANIWYIGGGLSLFISSITFLFISGMFRLFGQLKDIGKIILLKMGDHIEEEENGETP